jgi:tRNA/tmRNA/rRNA uracil-C5-methylase (TrmA/RlmC/RlmD family)
MAKLEVELEPGCEAECPGCAHRGLPADESARLKRLAVLRAFPEHEPRVSGLRAAPGRWGYRGKVCLRARHEGGLWKFGFLAPAPRGSRLKTSERKLIAIPRCPIQAPRIGDALEMLSRVLPEAIPLVYVQFAGGLVTLVLKSAEIPTALLERAAKVADELRALSFEGLWVNLNPVAGHRVLNPKGFHLLWGTRRAIAPDGLSYGPSSFAQVLPGLHAEALERAARHLAPGPDTAVIDLCSGRGASLSLWRARGARAIGVELSGESVGCAEECGLEVLRGLASHRIPQLEAWLADRPLRVLYANPPRGGLEPEVLQWILGSARPIRLAYLSCNPATLARDLDVLAPAYDLREIIPYDFFPGTHHVEALALLAR